MVDSVSAKPIAGDRWKTTVNNAAPVQANRSAVVDSNVVSSSGLGKIVADLAASPPVDIDRVHEIRVAIANNTYPIAAETIADRMVALKLNWNPNEQA